VLARRLKAAHSVAAESAGRRLQSFLPCLEKLAEARDQGWKPEWTRCQG